MHANAPHRARLIAAPSKHPDRVPDAHPEQLSQQAERFRRLCERGHRPDKDAQATEREHAPTEASSDAPASETDPPIGIAQRQTGEDRDDAPDDEGGHGAESGDGDSSRDGTRDEGDAHARYAIPMLAVLHRQAHTSMHTPMHTPPRLRSGVAQGAQTPNPDRARAVTAIEAPMPAGERMHRLLESIVAELADFCANPAVLKHGGWQITIPLDPALLPACTLDVALSHFLLTLRFVTTDDRSRHLISQHTATLRASLEQVLQSRFDDTRGIEIIVT